MSYSYITLLSNSLKTTIPEIFLVTAISIILLFGLLYQDKSIPYYSNKKFLLLVLLVDNILVFFNCGYFIL